MSQYLITLAVGFAGGGLNSFVRVFWRVWRGRKSNGATLDLTPYRTRP